MPASEILGWGSCMYNGAGTPSLYWGARAIFHPRRYEHGARGALVKVPAYLDIPPDRRGWAGTMYEAHETRAWDELQERTEFLNFRNWLQEAAYPQLEKWIQGQDSSSGAVFELIHFEGVRYHYRASPNASYGYVYIAAWREEVGNHD